MFLTLEGIEGCGKSTQAQRLAAALGERAFLTHEPGATALGRGVRSLLLDPTGEVSKEAELLLYAADRAQHVIEIIRPALANGRIVVCDRYVDSTLAYQGYGRGLSLELIRTLMDAATGGLNPDLTLLLDVPVATGLARVGRRGSHDRLEAEDAGFHERVRAGYLEIARTAPDRIVLIDAADDPDEVEKRAWAALAERRGIARPHGVR